MINTIAYRSQHADFGMPASARMRVASLRALFPSTVADDLAGEQCVFIDMNRSEAAVSTDTFLGLSAWSPPI